MIYKGIPDCYVSVQTFYNEDTITQRLNEIQETHSLEFFDIKPLHTDSTSVPYMYQLITVIRRLPNAPSK